ncbi:MAG TPA: TonB-dependent receptor [Bacteroidales bacterium]|nr:TonB-dependent receptor [Bacteroidales bacterium]HRZ48838.1 TonB-dependent receptor [Bacteroidales bacterium]
MLVWIMLWFTNAETRAQASQQGADRPAVVTGLVFDGTTNHPLPGATILSDQGKGTITGNNGRFRLLPGEGKCLLRFRFVGYAEVTRELTLRKGDSVDIQVAMTVQAREMERVVVSAGRAPQQLADLVVSASVIRAESIDAAHTRNADELLNHTAGVEILDGQASIRGGSGFSYGAGSRVMVLVDGLPYLSADAGHVSWQALPLENLEQIEIIKGASSVLYGSSALNGIVSLRTAEASKEGITRWYAGGGIFDAPRTEAWKWWNSPRVFSDVSFSHLKRYGRTDIAAGVFARYDNGYRKYNEDHLVRINLRLKRKSAAIPGLEYGLGIHGRHSRKTDFILWDNGTTGALVQDTSTAQRMTGSGVTLDPFIGFQQGTKTRHDLRGRILWSENVFPDGGDNNSRYLSEYAEYQFHHVISPLFTLNAGASWYHTAIFSPFYGNHRGNTSGAYLQMDVHPGKRLKLVAGTRIEHAVLNDEQGKPVPLFRAGGNYRAGSLTFLRASFGQGYRHPSIAEKYASTTLGAVTIIANPQINPESGWNTEIGIKQGFRGKLAEGLVDLALFYSENKDMIEFVFGVYQNPVTGLYGYGFRATNVEYSRVYGTEAELVLRTRLGVFPVTLQGGYVFMYPVKFNPHTGKNTDEYLKFRRKHALNLNLGTSWKKFEGLFQATARSPLLDVDYVFLNPSTRETILPGFYDYWINHNKTYVVLDASLSYPLSYRFTISASVKNLTNTEYMGRPGDIRPHRHFILRISGRL